MLKALQLVGFKSFADKTRFEFPPGITVVVGPNGSGKSNIVDGIKWVLGEQSVKSLRGKEMTDVIFNGSAGRRAQNSADVMLTFDNTDRRLPVESDEVHVGRRVYRSGEGEYLINGQPSRLRDIRDMLAGTGVSAQHYSIIEQGKVDSMLQASPKDRRVIFEEAAGISRFKAKKIETLRRLDRVDQNLLRLSDIVDEVDGRLRSVRKQAGKAHRYKDYSDRLQDLRTQVGSTDWRRLTDQIETYQRQLAELRAESASASAQQETLEARTLEVEAEIDVAEQAMHQHEQTLAQNRERIAACESTIEHERSRQRDLAAEIERRQKQMTSMSCRTRDLSSQLESTLQDVTAAESRYRQVREQTAEIESVLAALEETAEQLRRAHEQCRAAHMQAVRRDGELANEISAIEAKVKTATTVAQRGQQQLSQIEQSRQHTAEELAELNSESEQALSQRRQCDEAFRSAKQSHEDNQKKLKAAQSELGQLQLQQGAASERAAVLEELQRRYEGLNSGVKDVLIAARNATDGPFQQVIGLVADVLEVQVEMAPLIETALGDRAGFVVVAAGSDFADYLRRESHPFDGRVGFVMADDTYELDAATENVALAGEPGVIGRADQFVRAAPQFVGVAQRLLGSTWIVADLGRAMLLARRTPGQAFVTLAGQYVGADGTICVGPKEASSGLLSRRSELRELRGRLDDLQAKVEVQEGFVERLSEAVADGHARVENFSEQRDNAQARAAECQRLVSAADERQRQLDENLQSVRAQLEQATNERDAGNRALAGFRESRADVDAEVQGLETELESRQKHVQETDIQRQRRNGEATAAKVELAKCEQRLEHLTARLRQNERDQEERQRSIDEAEMHLADARQRATDCDRRILQLEGEAAELYLRKESLAQQSIKLTNDREQQRAERGELQVQSQQVRGRLRKLETELHEQELAESQIRLERNALESRMRDDYAIELADVDHEETEEEHHEREVVEQEINELRRKIQNIGNVNLDALEELEDLETRFGDLSKQHEDLTAAKKSLEHIIEKINTDSRQLFIDTLESVRVHFQELFRKLFGGGQADIITNDQEDILESGLEIVARPPGKELRSISLLSGGEKTLTCVALLMAIFKNRPSPFCVLDEVDAALDEANIGRFVGMLTEFLQWTQFIVVTHSKKTMTAANTLYGVTMQESGISKRVSVRFEDVSETGEILRTRDDEDVAGAANGADSAGLAEKDDETQAA